MVLTSRQKIIVGLMIFLLVLVFPKRGVASQSEEGQITIVFDFSHDQLFSPANQNFTEAVDALSNRPEYFVRILTEGELSAENLTRSHILVISNPGKEYTTAELEVISNFVNRGGSLFLLCDFQIADRRIGNPVVLNEILQRISEPLIQFSTVTEGEEIQGDAIYDLNNSLLLPYNIQVNQSFITLDPLRATIGANINSVLVAGGSLTAQTSGLIISTGAETSQAVNINEESIHSQPGWLAAFWVNNSRVVLCTSNTMFSDTSCVGTNQSWFHSLDNSILWLNIFSWLSASFVQDPTLFLIFIVSLVLIVGMALFIYSFWLKRRGR
jgi:hypothetical protein